jgi:predicted transcriptional regulator
MEPERVAELAHDVAHPLRVAILDGIRHAGELSPRGFANDHGAKLAAVSHHFRALAGAGHIELNRTEPRRGAVEHFYVLSERGRAVVAWLRKAPR